MTSGFYYPRTTARFSSDGSLWHNNCVTLANKEPRAVKSDASFWDTKIGIAQYCV